MASITFGYILAEILSETNLIKFIGNKTSKIAEFGIHPALTPIPALYLVSPRVAHANASAMLKDKLIKPIDLYIAILASNLPLRVMYIYRYYLPVLLPLLGVITLYYIGLRIIFDFLLVFIVLMIGRKRYKGVKFNMENSKINLNFSKDAFKNGLIKGLRASLKFGLRFTPIFALVVFMIKLGILDKITAILSPILGKLSLDSLGIAYITTAMFSPAAAYGIAKVMLSYNYPINKVLGCMFLGTGLFTLLYESWSRIFPFYSGLYPKNVTLNLLLLQVVLPSFYNIFLGIFLVKL
ncbi:conserved hypothetical protein [Methanocaldococcus fervens AG86]|uniref:Nucleoside recognition domain protein n=2 Tax=Methanocaldococcus TaxID=196118 RepID=C7P6Q8_METFA|nr:conserved hypothetical protein [Methanocaldococcus fervens AG86]